MIATDVEQVVDLYERFGHDRYDEEITQLDHALQTAALARADGASDDLVVAALLHDIGHLLDLAGLNPRKGEPGPQHYPDLQHEIVGARYLSGLFPPSVTAPIALHVRAKRFLCATEPGYAAGLSAGSSASLKRQGGPMGSNEMRSFEANPAARDTLRLRCWDDMGKIEGLEVPRFDTYQSLLALFAVSWTE